MASKVLRRRFIQELPEYLQDTVSREDLQLLMTKHEHWNALLEQAELSRNEEAVLQTVLKELIELAAGLPKNLQDKILLEALTQLKREFEETVVTLHALADHIDKVHRVCTISKVVTSSAATASGVLRILGLLLAPVTAGGSLVLSATGMGLGAVATVAGAATAVVEERSRWSAEVQARCLVSATMNRTMNRTKNGFAMGKIIFKLSKGSFNIVEKLSALGQHIHAIKTTRANPHLVADARILSTDQLSDAFQGTALAMTKKVRIRGLASEGFFLILDVCFLVKDLMHLQKGAKSESAEALRILARELQEELKEWVLTLKTL